MELIATVVPPAPFVDKPARNARSSPALGRNRVLHEQNAMTSMPGHRSRLETWRRRPVGVNRRTRCVQGARAPTLLVETTASREVLDTGTRTTLNASFS
jgi:hypothetical protein